jgi:hypothetical protein
MTSERHEVGTYLVVGRPGEYQVMENFGAYRISKKRFKTLTSAVKRAEAMNATTT